MSYEENRRYIDERLLEIVHESLSPDTEPKRRNCLDFEYDRLVHIKSLIIKQHQRKEQKKNGEI